MSFLDKINPFKKKRKLIVVNLDSKDLSSKEINEALRNESTYWKMKFHKLMAKLKQEASSNESQVSEDEKIKSLNEMEKELNKKDYVPVDLFRILKIIEKQKKQKSKKRLVFTTFVLF